AVAFRPEWEMLEVDADGNAEDLLLRDAGADDELLHLVMRHLHAVDPRGVLLQCGIRAVELGIARSSGSPVEVAQAETMRRFEPARPQRPEVIVVEDGLSLRETRP